MKVFLRFVLVSGTGWVLDFLSYTALTQLAGLAPAYTNVISSMVGVTYVWMVALNRVFDKGEFGKSLFLPVYWGYQFVSISCYSLLIAAAVALDLNAWIARLSGVPVAVVAKIVLTPPNLLTNFIFMSFLTKFMKAKSHGQVLK